MKAKEKAKKTFHADGCADCCTGKKFCRECYDFGLFNPRVKGLEIFC